MNRWQAERQLRYMLENRAWSGSATLVFPDDAVVISQNPIEAVIAEIGRLPCAIIRTGSMVPDPAHSQSSDIYQASIGVTVAVGVDGNWRGSNPLTGSYRQGQTDSRGRGLLEIEEEVLDEIHNFNVTFGMGVKFVGSTFPDLVVVGEDPSIVYCDYAHAVTVTRQRSYPAAEDFTATDATGGNCNLAWTLPAARFDRLSMILRRASGSTAPATYDAGTGVTLAGLLSASVTDSPGAGTFSYSLFAAYDEYRDVGASGRTAQRYGAARSQTVVVT